ncbi:OmpH family outer membrane protein [Flavobacterium sp.]|uniref:OmpH family outer membrane protein n=1 Tax=Flavobacterium sp. TaxID=239 RepID=UPI0026218513|nr:OmpH family outer membrane protein [Flavobacterium sp.]
MRNFTIYLALLLCLFASKMVAQTTFESKAKAIADKIEKITKEEKETLKAEVEAVNVQLENGSITKEQADAKKQELAQARATIIENRVAVAQEELKDLVQQKVDGKIEEEYQPNKFGFVFSKSNGKNGEKYQKYRDSIANRSEKRTTSQFVFALGLNNVVTDGSVENSDFRFAGSRFYEWGLSYNSRLFKNDNLLHLKYGASLMYNDLRPTENRVFAVNGNQTQLQTSAINLKNSRFRNVYLVAPIHLEFDFTKKKEKDGKTYFKTHNSFRLGVGGYAGIRIKSKQKIEYEIDDIEYDEKAKGDFNASNFIYGLSAYIGYKETSLYIKYDLNPIFQDNVVKQNNVSLGIRFDFN